MKAAVTGYITAVINNYTRTIENLRDNKVEGMAIRRYETIREELSDLLDFIEDIPEENKEPVTVVLNSNCENVCEVERNQLNTIAKQEEEIKYYRRKIQLMDKELNRRNEDIETYIKELQSMDEELNGRALKNLEDMQ